MLHRFESLLFSNRNRQILFVFENWETANVEARVDPKKAEIGNLNNVRNKFAIFNVVYSNQIIMIKGKSASNMSVNRLMI